LELIRPLLGTTRSEIRNLLSLWNLPSWPDSSNQIIAIRRNRIRRQLMPYMRFHYNPKFDQALARWSEIIYAENIYLNRVTFMILSKIEVRINNSFYNICTNGIDIAVLRSCPIVFQRRILKLFLYKHIKLTLSFRYIEHIRLFFLSNQKSGRIPQPKKKTQENFFQLKYPSISLPSKGKLLVFSHFLILLYT
jgi:tRNA(Ile)-lysidine synthase